VAAGDNRVRKRVGRGSGGGSGFPAWGPLLRKSGFSLYVRRKARPKNLRPKDAKLS